jgi:4-amino-4-deoxy-L-arabinose transferase-like glycosyltransferase
VSEPGAPAAGAVLAPPGGWLSRNRAWLAVTLFVAVVFFTRSWEGDLHGDPVHYAAVAKNILSTGEWLTLYDGPDLPYANKPPLIFWLVAVNFRLFGPSTYAAVFWSCLFGLGACLLTYAVGERLFGPTAGVLAACMTATFSGVLINFVDLRLDSAATFCTVLAVYAALRAAEGPHPRWLLLAGLAGGLGMMVKPSAAAFAGVLTVLLLAVRRPRLLVHPSLFAAAGLALVIAGPWHLAMLGRHGAEFGGTYFGEQIGSRIALGGHLLRNLAQNLGAFLVRGLPWWPLSLYALTRWRRAGSSERWGMQVALLWVAVVVVLMAIPPKRYDRYLVPAYPAMGLLAGYGLSRIMSERHRAAAPAIAAFAATALLFVLATVPVPLHSYQCRGFVQARPLLDRLSPGATITAYDPRFPTGPSRASGQWGLRAETIYYLDRYLVNCSRPEDLVGAGQQFVICKDDYAGALSGVGYDVLLELDDNDWLLGRCPRGD